MRRVAAARVVWAVVRWRVVDERHIRSSRVSVYKNNIER